MSDPAAPMPDLPSPPRVIAIVGGSGAGKTTLTHALASALESAGCLLLSEDDYYRCATSFPDFDEATHNFDEPAAKDLSALAADLAALKAGHMVEKPRYDFTTHRRRPDTESVAPAPFILIEGLHALTEPQLRAAVDFSVYVDAASDLRLARRLLRDVTERGRTPQSVLDFYVTRVRPMHSQHVAPQAAWADLALDSSEISTDALTATVLEAITLRGLYSGGSTR
jgi:uridine kinase